jgi:hypothetical protein
MLKRLSVTFAFALSLAAATAAHASDKLKLERIDFKTTPTIKMYLTYLDGDGRPITGRAKEDFKLVLDAVEQGTASAVQSFGDSKEPVNLVVVAQNGPTMKDVLDDAKRGIGLLADSLPPQSKMALLAYNGDTKRLSEMGAPADAQSAARTMPADDESVEPRLLDAVRIAMDQLKAIPKGQRKMIVIFADGIDIDMDAHSFNSIGDRAAQDEIIVDIIGFNAFDASKLRNVSSLSKKSNGNDRQLKSAGEISSAFNNIIDEIKNQYVATFDIALAGGDPKEHQFQVVVSAGGREAFSGTLSTKVPKAQHPPKKADSGSKWWIWLLVIVLGGGLLALLAWLIFREQPEKMPVEEEPAAAPAPAPVAAPQGPMKTMALDMGGPSGTPMVGWIVGTSGKYADQTFKLKPSRTVIGTGAECDIKVEDQFMSSKHCEVRFEGGMYKLFDLGSTNGIVVNDKKVREHDLVDNDLIRCGRTEFKFKSVS